eukprot:GHVL01022734.1.p2 GENE.GHVL01022734.1~~GHVL01022734.1.p2  ORF type:complete len:205 (-),score=33.57 GHVL01022734.1:729-1343(-)
MSTTAAAQKQQNVITLKGSTAIITEFFEFSIYSILYQRGLYDSDRFDSVQHYGLKLMVATDEPLRKYLRSVLDQLNEWILGGQVRKLVLVITSADTGEALERWTFNVEAEATGDDVKVEKPMEDITKEIQAIIRQITASVTFLPLLEEACTFDLLVHTAKDADVPTTWEESEAKLISNSEEVKLRSFTTKIHRVDGIVSYKVTD